MPVLNVKRREMLNAVDLVGKWYVVHNPFTGDLLQEWYQVRGFFFRVLQGETNLVLLYADKDGIPQGECSREHIWDLSELQMYLDNVADEASEMEVIAKLYPHYLKKIEGDIKLMETLITTYPVQQEGYE